MRDRYLRIIMILVLVGLGIWINFPTNQGLKIGDFERTLDVVLGLDLQGGLQVLLEVPEGFATTAQDLETARQILENRSNGLGVSEVLFQVAGNRRIVGEFPGLTDTAQMVDVLKTTGQLEFIDLGDVQLDPGTPVQTDLGTNTAAGPTPTPEATSASNTSEQDLLQQTTPEDTQNKIWHTIMTGDQLTNVQVQNEATRGFYITFNLKPEGAQIFSDFTSQNVNKFLAIVLDGNVVSSPRINGPITGGEVMIEGTFDYDSANALAVQLKIRLTAYPVGRSLDDAFGPTLGKNSLNKSMIAGLIGFAIITLFMIIFYRLPGAIAILAILVYGLITLTIYKLIPVTLTLPGIAGFLLSMGGALDANILIFERLKEELRNGRKTGQALELAWKRAWPSIRDSNAATLITSGILFLFGSSYGASTVKGFALTLFLGVMVSLFGAFVVTRTFLNEILNALNITNLKRWFGI